MDRSNVIKLVGKSFVQDTIGQYRPTESLREVYCDVRSITRAEWYDAGRKGFQPDFSIVMFAPDYEGEDELIFDGRRYSIYRTYIGQNETIELYCQSIGGLKQNGEENQP